MKKLLVPLLVVLSALTLLTGCVSFQLGGGSTSRPQNPSIGQQMMDLQRARGTGAITEPEYQAQKARLLGTR